MKIFTIILYISVSSTLFAQLPKSLITPLSKTSDFSNYKGSIYMNYNYEQSTVIHEKSRTYDAELKYNIHTDAIEFNSKGQVYEIKKNVTTHVRIDDSYLYYCNFEDRYGTSRNGYYILVELTDRYRIYKRLTTKIIKPQERTATSVEVPGIVKINTKYYIEEDQVIMELPKNKKSMLALFSDKEDELKKYLKKEKIRLGKEEDLIRLVARYNALKSSDSLSSKSLLSNSGNL
ncbi:hypothetical protein ABW636_01840 [Aquimarina sp. 2201CG1-2-11]|uniref:hypothetical protein n=1 Tax=Aquimarina discodermiae TaxID=3231043 RepID=UPI003461A302